MSYFQTDPFVRWLQHYLLCLSACSLMFRFPERKKKMIIHLPQKYYLFYIHWYSHTVSNLFIVTCCVDSPICLNVWSSFSNSLILFCNDSIIIELWNVNMFVYGICQFLKAISIVVVHIIDSNSIYSWIVLTSPFILANSCFSSFISFINCWINKSLQKQFLRCNIRFKCTNKQLSLCYKIKQV